jgi:ribosomal protein S18 acetylase RimI-like enzyme
MRTIPLDDSNLDEAIDFIARLNQIKAHNIGYLSESAKEITADVRALQPPEGFGRIIVSDREKLVGLLGVELDIELGRCWLYGPLVENEDWDSIADLLYDAVLSFLPPEISDQEIYCHKQNVRLQGFALRQGFTFHSEGAVLTLDAGQKGHLPNPNSLEFVEEHNDQFIALHARLFPNTYYSGEQLIKLAEDDDKRLFIHLVDASLVGYVFTQGREAYKDGYIDFIGVDERFRRQGIATNLVANALNWFFQYPYVEKVTLTVNTENTPAMRMYQKIGFKMESVSPSYRKRI